MSVAHAPLYVGAFFLILFTAILAIGSLIGLVGLVAGFLRPAAKARVATISAGPVAGAAASPAAKQQVVEAETETATDTDTETFVPAGAEYAGC